MTLESKFQADLIVELKEVFPGCVVLKNDANYLQGFPDLLVLFNRKWFALECKASESSPYRPNQEWWLDYLDNLSIAFTIYPDNKEEVLRAIKKFASRA